MSESSRIWEVAYNAENRPVRFTSEDGNTIVECTYDFMGRRATRKVTSKGEVTLHQRYLYRGYLQIAACDLNAENTPILWHLVWDPTQPLATRPLAIRKDDTWYTYGWDLTKNISELYTSTGTFATAYTYTPYGEVTTVGNVEQPIQWSSEFNDAELGLVYYNYRHYNPADGNWLTRDLGTKDIMRKKYEYAYNSPIFRVDILGLNVQGGFAFSGWDLGGYNEDKFFKDRAGGRNNPNVGLGSSGTDLLSHLENLSKQEKDCCIKDFRIAGHGWGSHNDGIPSSSENFESGFVLDKSDQDNYSPFDNKVADINDLSAKITDGSIKFCKQCTISIYACRMSDAFIEALGRATGCTVTASGGACRENQKGDGWETNADKKGDINQFRKSVAGAKAKNAGRIHVPIPFK